MKEISIYDDPIYGLLEELYRLNRNKWYKAILNIIMQQETSYAQVKEELSDVPEILIYRCLEELIEGKVIRKLEDRACRTYALVKASSYVQGILEEIH